MPTSPPVPRLARRSRDQFISQPSSVRNATLVLINVTVLIVLAGSVIVWVFDHEEFPDIGTAIWYTLQTVTTVGYGDVTPTTVVGRSIGGLVMIVAVALLTIINALITSILIDASQRQRRAEQLQHDKAIEEQLLGSCSSSTSGSSGSRRGRRRSASGCSSTRVSRPTRLPDRPPHVDCSGWTRTVRDPRVTGRSERAGLGNAPNGDAPRPPGASRVLMIGDIIGKPGRQAIEHVLPGLREERGIDFVTANGENVAGGMGLTSSTADALLRAGVDVITSGNHIWDKREIYPSSTRTSASCGRSTTARTTSRVAAGASTTPSTAATSRSSTSRAGPTCSRSRTRSPTPTGCWTRPRAAAADPPGRLPLRDHVREERAGAVSRRAGQRGRGHAHPRRHRRRADPARAAPPTRPTSG